MAEEQHHYPLHEAVFDNDLVKLSCCLRVHDVTVKDKHGNTALHVAVMLGRTECIQLLLKHDAPVKVKNGLGWSVLAEAVSYGDRPTISCLVRKMRQQSRDQLQTRRPNLVKALKSIDDFYMELKWDFQSWVPLLSRILPSDVCKIYKRGANVRVDTTLVDFSDMRWERGDISFLFNMEAESDDQLMMLDNVTKKYQRLQYEETESDVEDEVDLLMSTDIMAAQFSTKSIVFARARSGWVFRADRTEIIAGLYESDIYVVHGLSMESRKRREHLSHEDVHKNKVTLECLTRGTASNGSSDSSPEENELPAVVRRESLRPPTKKTVTWSDYINAEPNEYPLLGRDLKCKESTKHLSATIAMSAQFPLTVEKLLDVLEVLASFKHFRKLRNFITCKLPPGFPVQLEIPILPTITAKITFQRFELQPEIDGKLFCTPADYTESLNRFADL